MSFVRLVLVVLVLPALASAAGPYSGGLNTGGRQTRGLPSQQLGTGEGISPHERLRRVARAHRNPSRADNSAARLATIGHLLVALSSGKIETHPLPAALCSVFSH